MELYGRPQVVRRNTLPTVPFLNDSKSREESTGFTPPNSSRNQEKDAPVKANLEIKGKRDGSLTSRKESGRTAATAASTDTYFDSRPPPSGQLPSERAQSGGVRRPVPGVPTPSVTMAKQRPNTSRESSRHSIRPSSSPRLSSEFETLFTRRQTESHLEFIDVEEEQHENRGNTSLDEAYIRQIKADILFCHQLLSREQLKSTSSSSSLSRSHTHVKNVLNMRESRTPSPGPFASSDVGLQSHLVRYNFSSDPVQLRSAKLRLEDLLAKSLIQLMQQFLELRDDLLDDHDERKNEDDRQQLSEDLLGLLRPSGNHIPFANGCASDPASIYAGCVFGVLQRVEKFRAIIVGLQSEKTCLLKSIHEKDRNMQRLAEQVELFKDALAKSVAKHSKTDAKHQLQRLTTASKTVAYYDGNIRGPQFDIEKELERSAHINTLERERAQLETIISKMQSEEATQSRQLRLSRAEADQHASAAIAAQTQLAEAVAKSAHDLQTRDQLAQELQRALKTMTEHCRHFEEVDNRGKEALERERHDLEKRIITLEEEVRTKTNLVGQQASAATELKQSKERVCALTSQLRTAESKLEATERASAGVRAECDRERALAMRLQQELDQFTWQLGEVTNKFQQLSALNSTQESSLRQTELKLSQAHADIQRQTAVIQHQANQLGLLEMKLSKSVLIDENEQKRRQQEEETAWHQKIAAVEHALEVERQTMQSLKEQHLTSITVEREKAAHSISQAKAVSLELETANLCLAERKRQREKELQEFTQQKAQLLDRISHLLSELDAAKATIGRQQLQANTREDLVSDRQEEEFEGRIQDLQDQLAEATAEVAKYQLEASTRLEQLRAEYETKEREAEQMHCQSVKEQIESYRCVADNALAVELAIRQQLDVLTAERDVLLHKLQGERSTPRGSALSDARVEIQRAKLKIAALEKKLSESDMARGKDSDGKAALLAAREKKLIDDQKSVKKLKQDLTAEKKQLQPDRDALNAARAQVEADKLRNIDDQKLLRQIISLMASRLALQMKVLQIIPPEMAAAQRSVVHQQRQHQTVSPSSFADVINKFQLEHSDLWRDMQLKWAHLQQELDDGDWQLVHMRNRLEELNLIASLPVPSSFQPTVSRPKTPTTSPFSDAIAAGRETVPVAEQLHTSASKLTIPATPQPLLTPWSENQSDGQNRSDARLRDEEHETFAIALAKEMRAMQASYETKLSDLHEEIHKIQKLRMESAQRLRVERDEEKTRNQQIVAQLTDRCATLEAQLDALQRVFAMAQDQQIALLQQYSGATTDAARSQILRMLHVAVAEAWKVEMARRDAHEQDRVRKLLDYCGSSSVAVDREDKTRLL